MQQSLQGGIDMAINWDDVQSKICFFGTVWTPDKDEDPVEYENTATLLERRLAEALIKIKVCHASDYVVLWEATRGLDLGDTMETFDRIPMGKTCWLTVQDGEIYVETVENINEYVAAVISEGSVPLSD